MTRYVALVLLGACSFGVDGDFAVTEAGLVGVRSLSMSELDVDGASVSSSSGDGVEFVITFEQADRVRELWIPTLRTVLSSGGVGVLRFRDANGWSVPRAVWLSPTSIAPTDDPYTSVVSVDIVAARIPKAQEEVPSEQVAPQSEGVPEGQSVPEESVGELILSVTDGHC